jgi:arylsulfatase A-like enzyme
VPLLAHVPGLDRSETCDELVSLGDVTATILRFAGCDVPDHMDSIPLPELGHPRPGGREQIIGVVQGGWMIYDGEWRLSKYATGECLLFNVQADPGEQRNLYYDPAYVEVRTRLDTTLTQAIMRSLKEANHERRVYVSDLSQDPRFGREGWLRTYPRSHDDR